MSTPGLAGGRLRVVDAHDDARSVDRVDRAAAARDHGDARVDRDRRAPCPCRPAASRHAASAPPGAACSSPSARGSRRRARGTESARRRPTRSASATRPCTGCWSGVDSVNSFWCRLETSSSVNAPLPSSERIRLRDHVLRLVDRRQVLDLVGHAAVLDLAIRRLEEAVLVGARIDGQRIDQADVRTFRRLDRADAPVVRRMHVADLEARHARASGRLGRAPRRDACASLRTAGCSGP